MRKVLLTAIIAIPVLYYFALFVGAATYPGYSHVTRYASELGAAEAPYPWLFNDSIMIVGLCAILGGFGLAGALRELSGRQFWAIAAGLALATWGVSMVLAGWFPMPDDRHGGYGLGFAGPPVPLFTRFALGAVPRSSGIRIFLAIIFIGSMLLFAIMMGVGGLVTSANVGIWQRINSGFGIPWLLVIGIWLMRYGSIERQDKTSATT
jgi:hypothetical protein